MYGTCGKVGPTGSVLPQLPSRPSGAQGTTLDKKDSVGVRTSAPCCTTCTTSMERARTPEKEMRSRKQGGTPEASAQRPPPHAACAASQARITLAGGRRWALYCVFDNDGHSLVTINQQSTLHIRCTGVCLCTRSTTRATPLDRAAAACRVHRCSSTSCIGSASSASSGSPASPTATCRLGAPLSATGPSSARSTRIWTPAGGVRRDRCTAAEPKRTRA
eukprot:scaffold2600_cov103-Isochrysis_galbana.AAC.2